MDHGLHGLGRILQVGGHEPGAIPLRVSETGLNGDIGPEIPRQFNDRDPPVLFRQRTEDVEGVVA